MSLKDVPAGWHSACTQEVPLTLKLLEEASSSVTWEKLFPLPVKIPSVLGNSSIRKYEPLTKAVVPCGWFSHLEQPSMSRVFVSIPTDALCVECLRQMRDRLAFYKDKAEGASLVFAGYSDQKVVSGILERLTGALKLPADISWITTLYLLSLRRSSTPDRVQLIDGLLRKIMLIPMVKDSILTHAMRTFVWMERDRKIRTRNMPAEANPLKSWSAQSSCLGVPQTRIDGNGGIIILTQFEIPSMGNMKSFAWEVSAQKSGVQGMIYAMGFADHEMDAAEAAYQAFYDATTNVSFESAKDFQVGKEVVLMGNEITTEEFRAHTEKGKSYAFLVPLAGTDDRDEKLFVLNWPNFIRDKKTFEIESINKKVLTLVGGAKIDTDCYDVYVKNPEQYVDTEIRCKKCGMIGLPGPMAGRFCRSFGFVCGPCFDNMYEVTGELSVADFDQ